MSFLAGIKNFPTTNLAATEIRSILLLLPAHSVELNQLIFQRLDSRIYEHLRERDRMKGAQIINVRCHEIANAPGTSREVITRVLKKLEKEGKIGQSALGKELV
jgi:hypothetical protein